MLTRVLHSTRISSLESWQMNDNCNCFFSPYRAFKVPRNSKKNVSLLQEENIVDILQFILDLMCEKPMAIIMALDRLEGIRLAFIPRKFAFS